MKKMFLALICTMLAAGTVLAADALNADAFLAMGADAQAAAINSASPANLVALFTALADKATPSQQSNATEALLAFLNKNKETDPAGTEALVAQLNDAVNFLNIVKNDDGIYINKEAAKIKSGEGSDKEFEGKDEQAAQGQGEGGPEATVDNTIFGGIDETPYTVIDVNIPGLDKRGDDEGGDEPGPTPPGPIPPVSRRSYIY